jgi:hypothetical protein
MSKHTPGPWELSQDSVWPWSYVIESQEGVVVDRQDLNTYSTSDTRAKANARTGNEQCHANARLIAAAPDLLMALQMLYEETADYVRLNNLGGMDNQCMQLARAAIAKATP